MPLIRPNANRQVAEEMAQRYFNCSLELFAKPERAKFFDEAHGRRKGHFYFSQLPDPPFSLEEMTSAVELIETLDASR
jgi:hypothetical protein